VLAKKLMFSNKHRSLRNWRRQHLIFPRKDGQG
jgi:hypothetical protein